MEKHLLISVEIFVFLVHHHHTTIVVHSSLVFMHLNLVQQISAISIIITLHILLLVYVLVELRGSLLLLRVLTVPIVSAIHRIILVLLRCVGLVGHVVLVVVII
jgi:hypothetical protein